MDKLTETYVALFILVVVVVFILVGVVLAFSIRSRALKEKAQVGVKNQFEPAAREGRLETVSQTQQEDDSNGLPVDSPGFRMQLVLDDDQVFELKLPTTLGRSPENPIEIADDSVSAQHARIFFDHRIEDVCIEDMNSLNGIFVDGRPTIKSVLVDGARLTLGGVSLTFRKTSYLPRTR
jgi:pSer/pThr/pTyr-binding forkhead associated (FHA) protein